MDPDPVALAAWLRTQNDFNEAYNVLASHNGLNSSLLRSYDRGSDKDTRTALMAALHDPTLTAQEVDSMFSTVRLFVDFDIERQAETTLAPRWIHSRELGLKVFPFFRF